jgi:hypothetical protein
MLLRLGKAHDLHARSEERKLIWQPLTACPLMPLQIKEGQWFARDGKTKRKSSQYFEVGV